MNNQHQSKLSKASEHIFGKKNSNKESEYIYVLLNFGNRNLIGSIGYTNQTKLLMRKSIKLASIKLTAQKKYLKDMEKQSIQMFYKNRIVTFKEETLQQFIKAAHKEEAITNTIEFSFISMECF